MSGKVIPGKADGETPTPLGVRAGTHLACRRPAQAPGAVVQQVVTWLPRGPGWLRVWRCRGCQGTEPSPQGPGSLSR